MQLTDTCNLFNSSQIGQAHRHGGDNMIPPVCPSFYDENWIKMGVALKKVTANNDMLSQNGDF
jgi:hypothetical protein